MAPYTVHEVSDAATFAQVIPVIWSANHHPYQPYFAAYNPVFGPSREDWECGIAAMQRRRWAAHRANPASHWIYVRDETDGAVVGACEWDLYERDPYAADEAAGPPAHGATMWPEGSVGRQFVELMLRKQYAHRRRWLRRPHAVCHSMGVLPLHRRRGLGSLLMRWGMTRAHDMGLEVFIHATVEARWLYERHGLRVVQKIDVDMQVPDPSDEWEKLRHELGPLCFFLMWKPVHGVYVEGETQLPWEVEP